MLLIQVGQRETGSGEERRKKLTMIMENCAIKMGKRFHVVKQFLCSKGKEFSGIKYSRKKHFG